MEELSRKLDGVSKKVRRYTKTSAHTVKGGAVALVVLLVVVVYNLTSDLGTTSLGTSEKDFRQALQLAVGGVNPAPLQNFFVAKVKAGTNDDATKSAVYWITHRFFDNGGDIYEIYDFVNSNPELVFLKDAEKIYPDIFEKIRKKEVTNYSGDALLALLAYYEAIDRHGYANMGVWGIAANKYTEFAYYSHNEHLKNPNAKYTKAAEDPRTNRVIWMNKAERFLEKANEHLFMIAGNRRDVNDLANIKMIPDDLLVGLNQYASAVENMRAFGRVFDMPYSTREIYDFNERLAKSTVPRLYFFTNYLYATSLIYGGTATEENLKAPVERLVGYARSTPKDDWRQSVSRVLSSRYDSKPGDAGMYAIDVVKGIAERSPLFTEWLKENGWTDADLQAY